jgi:hypothetical protein
MARLKLLTSAECQKRYGDPYTERHMAVWDIPNDINAAIPPLPNRIYCNKDLVAPLEAALRNVIERGAQNEIKTWDGCFNIRKKITAPSMSLHSWGVAFDINAAWNQFGKPPAMSRKLVACFTDAGFDWGGVWSTPDGMHFQMKSIT